MTKGKKKIQEKCTLKFLFINFLLLYFFLNAFYLLLNV